MTNKRLTRFILSDIGVNRCVTQVTFIVMIYSVINHCKIYRILKFVDDRINN